MSSREIAGLTGKRHGDVIRDIRAMLDQLGDDANLRHVREEKDVRGYTACFHLDRYYSEVLVTGYDVLGGKLQDFCSGQAGRGESSA